MKRMVLALSLGALFLAGCGGKSLKTLPSNAVVVGAMLDQTGSQTDFTPEFTAACQLAVEDENARLVAARNPVRFALKIRDSKSTVAGATEAVTGFSADKVSFVLGPRTSAQCSAALPIAQADDIVLLAPRSVADDLALPNDALFRLISPDKQVIPLVAQTAIARGLKYICVLHRDDLYGTSALAIMKTAMQAAGGDVVYSQSYTAAAGPTDAQLQTFADAVIAQQAIHGAETGTAYFSLSEMVSGFAKLNAQPDTFRTVGSLSAQSLANVPSMLTNADARAYCTASNFQAVAFALANKPAVEIAEGAALLNRIAVKSGKATPDELSINVYDGMRVMLRASQLAEGNAIRSMADEIATSPAGTLGTMHFNENGDRIGEFYGVYSVDTTGVDPVWKRVSTLTH